MEGVGVDQVENEGGWGVFICGEKYSNVQISR